MRIKLIYAAVVTLALAAPIRATYAKPTKVSSNFPHIVSLVESPQGIRHWRILRHTLKLEIPEQSQPISQIIIESPSNLIIRNDIDVSDQSDKKITTDVSINERKVVLVFSEPIAPNSVVTIDMNRVKKTAITSGEKAYKISARLVGINAELPVGVARLRIY